VLNIIKLTLSLIGFLWSRKDYFFLNLDEIQYRCPHNALEQLLDNIKIGVLTMFCSILCHLPLLLTMHSAFHKTQKFTC